MKQPHLRSSRLLPLLVTALLAGCEPGGGSNDNVAPDAAVEPPPERAWYQFGLPDEILDEVTLFYLGHAFDGSADVAEVLETASRVEAGDARSWTREWLVTADRLVAVAEASEAAGHLLTAANAYLRGATYYRAALHRHADPYDPEVAVLAGQAVEAFENHLALSGSPCSPVAIPYEDTTLPGYFCRSPLAEGAAPVLLFHEGRDGWAEDGRFVADEAMRRGYHALLFDGPGMGKTLRLQGLPFRHDWEKVIGPVVDYVVAQPGVDAGRIGLIGLSMGGFLAPRAAVHEPRLRVLVANPGVIDWSAIYTGFISAMDPGLLTLLETDPEAFDQAIYAYMEVSEFLHWGFVDTMWHHGATSPSGLMTDLERYTLGADVATITARTLVVDAEAEAWGQSQAFFDALTCPKAYVRFTAAEAAQFHVQPGASGILVHRLFDWIDENL